MCNFFSLVTDGKGKRLFFNAEQRKKFLAEQSSYEPDSHTSIADFYGYKGKKEDTLNKYEYNPLTMRFQVDQLNTTDDSEEVKKWCEKLDFKTIVPELILKPIIHPFTDIKTETITDEDVKLLKQWASVRDSVWDTSVWYSVGSLVRDSVWDSVVGSSVMNSVRNSVRASVRASVRTSVGASVRDSVWGYISSFFDIPYKYDFSPAVKLWEKGLVPSYDGEVWRLHGYNGKILWEGKLEEEDNG